MDNILEDKLAHLVAYLEDGLRHKRGLDSVGLSKALDDPQVAQWLGDMRRSGRAQAGPIMSRTGAG